jgi:hypothetical protein
MTDEHSGNTQKATPTAARAHSLDGVPELTKRGEWCRLRLDGDRVAFELLRVAEFPK